MRLADDPGAAPDPETAADRTADLAAAAAFDGAVRPLAYASWREEGSVRAFVGPAGLPNTHPLARVGGLTNGLTVEDAIGG